MPRQSGLPPALSEIRAEIDRIDAEIVRLLAVRQTAVLHAGQIKSLAGLPFRDEDREAEIVEKAVERGEDLGVPKKQVRKIFRQVLRISAKSQASGD